MLLASRANLIVVISLSCKVGRAMFDRVGMELID
jgi:hypothetical protein